MKNIIAVCSTALLLSATAFNARADIVAGPITNSANGHVYYLLSPNTWTMSEAEAESLDGTLAIIRNAAEQKWVFTTFSAYDDVDRTGLWIGLHRTSFGGPFVWVTGEKLDYTNWNKGEPNNVGGIENCVHMSSGVSSAPGTWNDLPDNNYNDRMFGVAELSSNGEKKILSKDERALIGSWYEGGKLERPCWIAGTDNVLFVIQNNGFAARASIGADGFLIQKQLSRIYNVFSGYRPTDFNPQINLRGEIVKDKILWSNGTWWSRKPMEYKAEKKLLGKVALAP